MLIRNNFGPRSLQKQPVNALSDTAGKLQWTRLASTIHEAWPISSRTFQIVKIRRRTKAFYRGMFDHELDWVWTQPHS